MPVVEVHVCECPSCRENEQADHHALNLFASRLDEQQRRWFAALEAKRLGHGGEKLVAEIIGIDPKTIRRGRRELDGQLEGRPIEHIRAAGGGRHAVESDDPELEKALLAILEPETSGDPMGSPLYKRSSLRNLQARLAAAGHQVSHETVRRLLKKLCYSPRVNAKEDEESSVPPEERDAQFAYIEEQKRAHKDAGEPVISVDSKKKS